MIIIMRKNILNDKAAKKLSPMYGEIQYYPNISLSKTNDSEIILLDLEADGEFQEKLFYASKLFLSQLASDGFSSSIKAINLLLSDCNPSYPLTRFCQNFTNAIALSFPKSNVVVRAPVDIMHPTTLLIPASEKQTKWEVYSLSKTNKKLLWSEADPITMLKTHPLQTQFHPQTRVETSY